MNNQNELTVEHIDFMGDDLVAIKNSETDKIYVGVKWICQGIGFNKRQADVQRLKIRNDEVLSEGVQYLYPLTKGGQQNVLCIEMDYLPLWLAKISITPTMKNEHPETAQRLKEYQLKAKDVLAQHFIKKNINLMVPATFPEALRLAANLAEENLKNRKLIAVQSAELEETIESNERKKRIINSMTEAVRTLYYITRADGMIDISSFSKQLGRNNGPYKVFRKMRELKILMTPKIHRNLPYQPYIDSGYLINRIITKHFNNEDHLLNKPFLTAKGVVWLTKKLRQEGFITEELPDIEKIIRAMGSN